MTQENRSTTVKLDMDTMTGLAVVSGLGSFLVWESFPISIMAVLAVEALYGLYVTGYLGYGIVVGVTRFVEWVKAGIAYLKQLKAKPEPVAKSERYTLFVGHDADTGEPIHVNVHQMKHTGIFGMTGSGKTTAMQTLVYELLANHSPADLKLAISDPKGHAYRIWRTIPHLFAPITCASYDADLRLLRELEAEMNYRGRLFDSMPSDRICEDINDYSQLRAELGLKLPHLPTIVVIFDEVQDVSLTGSEAEQIMKDLSKKARVYGIYLWPSTQRNTTANLHRDIQSNFNCQMVGWMGTGHTNYSAVAQVPKEVYGGFKYQPGRFMAEYKGLWRHVNVRLVGNNIADSRRKLEMLAKRLSTGREPAWPNRWTEESETAVTRIALRGPKEVKRAVIMAWMAEQQFTSKPTTGDFMAAFDVQSEATAAKWVDTAWAEYNKGG